MKVINQKHGKNYSLYHGDSCEVIKGIADNSIHYTITSPPFSSLYTYSASDRDMGNSSGDDEFFTHFQFLIKELYRVTMPGRLLSLHCMNLPSTLQHNGYIGIRDFRGELIKAFSENGWIYHSEVCIWKDPVVAMQRTKAIGLLHKQVVKDSAMSRQGIPDYLVTMRKPGKNEEPVVGGFEYYQGTDMPRDNFGIAKYNNDLRFYNIWQAWDKYQKEEFLKKNDLSINWEPKIPVLADAQKEQSIEIWQRYASPVWMDINPSNTLQFQSARESNDERHICLAKDSKVLTYKDGYKPIQDIEIGDLVLTHKGRWMPVIAKKKTSDNANVVNVKATGVDGLLVTPGHKLWTKYVDDVTSNFKDKAKRTNPSWVEANKLKNSYVNLKLPPVEESELTAKEWWIVGRWLADGHIAVGTSGRTSMHISCGDHKLLQFYNVLGESIGTHHKTIGASTQIRIKDPDAKLRNIVEKCGLKANSKKIPPEAFRLSPELSRIFLDGYLSGDGHFNQERKKWYATSVSKELLMGMQFVIQRAFGVPSSIYKGRPARVKTIQDRLVSCQQEWNLSFQTHGYSFCFLDNEGMWKKVKSVNDAGISETWNIHVLEDNSYTAEGCIVKNCPLQLDVIERGLQLWTNPGDRVLDVFNGIGSTGHVALKANRKYIGIELKESYYNVACRNLDAVDVPQQNLLDLMGYVG